MAAQTAWDVIVVGGGPGGAIAAKKLAEGGLRTLLIERKNLPRDKPCSGIVSDDAQNVIREEFGIELPAALRCRPNQCKGARIGLHGRLFDFPSDETRPAATVWRRNFDYWLVLKANEHGAEVWDECSLIGLAEQAENGQKQLSVRVKKRADDGRTFEFLDLTARYVVGADGAASVVRGEVYPETKGAHKLFCYQEYLEGTIDLDKSWYHHFPDRNVLPGTTWFEAKDGLLCIGLGYLPGVGLEQTRERTLKFYEEHHNLKVEKVVRHEGCVDLLNDTIEKVKQGHLQFYLGKDELNILLVGDAAEVIDLLGEGIYSAMRTGQIAAGSIITHAREERDTPVAAMYRENARPFTDWIETRWLKWYRQFKRYL